MGLTPGTRLGPYEVVRLIGAGAMGEVYQARDTKLGRDVALKILPELFATDVDRLERFEREARALASLNHPHIAQIYGIEDSSPTRALVMELVPGPTLAEVIATGEPQEQPSARADSISPIGRRGLPLETACRSPARSPKRSRRRTIKESCTAT